jgi:hypothetical protein
VRAVEATLGQILTRHHPAQSGAFASGETDVLLGEQYPVLRGRQFHSVAGLVRLRGPESPRPHSVVPGGYDRVRFRAFVEGVPPMCREPSTVVPSDVSNHDSASSCLE